jgi:hypothetical protein
MEAQGACSLTPLPSLPVRERYTVERERTELILQSAHSIELAINETRNIERITLYFTPLSTAAKQYTESISQIFSGRK